MCLLGSVIESDNRDFEREKKAWSDEFGMEGDKHRDKLVFYRFCGNKKIRLGITGNHMNFRFFERFATKSHAKSKESLKQVFFCSANSHVIS